MKYPTLCSLRLAMVGLVALSGLANAATYQPTWASVDTHTPAPEWFKDAKFGVYFHWGVFSVPAYSNEWYPRRMYDDGSSSGKVDQCYTHQVSTYGDPFSSWGYNNFIDGKNNKSGVWTQFKPVLVSQGGHWDPDSFAQLFYDAGAKYAGPVMEHHDGYSMWDSKANPWNSVTHGPKLNLAKLYVDAFRAKGLKIVSAMHHAYHFTGFYQYVKSQSDPQLKILFGQQGSTAENQLWFDKLKEVIDEFQPDILWQDFNLRAVNQTQLLNFLSYYFNQEAVWNKQVVTTWKDGEDYKCCVYDYERGGPADIVPAYWMTDDAIGYSSNWSYVNGMTYLPAQAIFDAFIDRVSKGGNLLLNISPPADGSLPQGQKTILLNMGSWLKVYGEAIYSTRTFSVFGEGPTKMGGGTSFSKPKAGTAQDIRYTRSKDSLTLYAIFMGWPGNGQTITLKSVTSTSFAVGSKPVAMLTSSGAIPLKFSQSGSGLTITLPSSQPSNSEDAYVVRIGLPPTVAIQEKAIQAKAGWKTTAQGIEFSFGSDATRNLEAFDLKGRSVYHTTVQGSTTLWDLRTSGGQKLSPGTYFVRVSGPSGVESMARIPIL